MKLQINKGQRFSNLTVLEETEPYRIPSGQTNRAFMCQCDCGSIKKYRLSHIVRGKITSCGCISAEQGDNGTKLHNTWRGMLNRVKNKNYIDAHRYYYRGITVCEEWKRFRAFKKWALDNGYVDGLQIDRIDNSKGYTPDNCRFVDSIQNMANRDITINVIYNGKSQPLSVVLRELDKIKWYKTIYERIKRGWVEQDAIDTPIKKGNYQNRWHESR